METNNNNRYLFLASFFFIGIIACSIMTMGVFGFYLLSRNNVETAQTTVDLGPTRTPLPTLTPLPALLDNTAVEPSPTPQPPPTNTPEQVEAPSEPAPPPTDTPVPNPKMSVDRTINIRQGPSTQYPVVRQVNAGDSADIIGKNDDSSWLYLAFADGATGWILGRLTTIDGDLGQVSVKQADSPPPVAAAPAPAPTNTPVPAQAAPAPAPAGPQYDYKLSNMFGEVNEGITQIRGYVKDRNGNAKNGVRIRVRTGDFCTISVPSGKEGVYPAGNYDILLDTRAKEVDWLVSVVDKPTDPDDNQCDPSARQLSEEVTARTDSLKGVTYVEWQEN